MKNKAKYKVEYRDNKGVLRIIGAENLEIAMKLREDFVQKGFSDVLIRTAEYYAN